MHARITINFPKDRSVHSHHISGGRIILEIRRGMDDFRPACLSVARARFRDYTYHVYRAKIPEKQRVGRKPNEKKAEVTQLCLMVLIMQRIHRWPSVT